jgi:glucoamylase
MKNQKRIKARLSIAIALGVSLASCSSTPNHASRAVANSPDVSNWLTQRVPSAETNMEKNLSPDLPGYKKGFVVAAPWVVPGVQNYRYHWVRDAALVMNTVVTRYMSAEDQETKKTSFSRLVDYINFSKQNQTAPQPENAEKVGLGEVKFNPDGTRYTNWMRPQNDGPALRAITMIRLSYQLIKEKQLKLVKHLFDGIGPGQNGIQAPGVIRADLDYIGEHWTDTSYEPWEEVMGHHFYTRLVQQKALLDGAWLAGQLGDEADANKYRHSAEQLTPLIKSHWIAAGQTTPSGTVSTGQIWDTFDYVKGVNYKSSGLDVVEVLAALHAHNELDNLYDKGDRFFSPSDDLILKTAFELSLAFNNLFPLAHNDSSSGPGVPIGRYPEDKYNGYDSTKLGNPWYLATAAYAELYYRCAEEWKEDGAIKVTALNSEFLATLTTTALKTGETISSNDPRFQTLISSVRALGDSYLRRVEANEAADGHLTEEFSRDDGTPTGAQDLSWSYASILTAAQHRH